MRAAIHVRPGSRSNSVGGLHGDALIVRVTERRVDGRATEAALSAVAAALGVPRRDVELVAGARSRAKIVRVPDSAAGRIRELRGLAG